MDLIERTQSESTMSYDEFTTLVKKLLDLSWGKNWGLFTSDAPSGGNPQDIKFPIITYNLKYLRPGVVGGRTREIKARQRFVDKRDVDGTQPSGTIIKGQVMDAEISFEVWEESNSKVDALAKRFREFMNIYGGYFKEKGLRNIMFLVMNDQSDNGSFRDNTSCRKLIYQVQFEEITEVPTDLFRDIIAELESQVE